MSLPEELGFGEAESDDNEGGVPELEEEWGLDWAVDEIDRTVEAWKTRFETGEYRDTDNQVEFDDQPEEGQESRVDSVGLEIMGKLDELASVCEELGLKTVKIHRSAHWMVVLFP